MKEKRLQDDADMQRELEENQKVTQALQSWISLDDWK